MGHPELHGPEPLDRPRRGERHVVTAGPQLRAVLRYAAVDAGSTTTLLVDEGLELRRPGGVLDPEGDLRRGGALLADPCEADRALDHVPAVSRELADDVAARYG